MYNISLVGEVGGGGGGRWGGVCANTTSIPLNCILSTHSVTAVSISDLGTSGKSNIWRYVSMLSSANNKYKQIFGNI